MIKNKKVIIFDLDGTLIDSIGIWNLIDRELIKRISDTVEENEFDIRNQRELKLKEYKGCADVYLEYCAFLKEKYKSQLSKEKIKELRYEIADNYLKTVIDYKPDAEKVLNYLKQKGFILAIATVTSQNTINIYKSENKNIINKANFNDIFSEIYSKDDVKNVKPHPEVYEKILNEFKVDPKECLIVEDSIVGVQAAKTANIESVVIYDKYSDIDRKQINELSQYQFVNFSQMLKYMQEELEEK